jgi:hypothetical protein
MMPSRRQTVASSPPVIPARPAASGTPAGDRGNAHRCVRVSGGFGDRDVTPGSRGRSEAIGGVSI